jgi:SAP domain
VALWRCRRCGTRFAVGLPYCPQCTSTDHEEDGAMPKNTVHGGTSNADLPPAAPQEPEVAPAEVPAPTPVAADETSLDERTVVELRDLLRARGLPTSGNKDELRDRLAEAELADDLEEAEG